MVKKMAAGRKMRRRKLALAALLLPLVGGGLAYWLSGGKAEPRVVTYKPANATLPPPAEVSDAGSASADAGQPDQTYQKEQEQISAVTPAKPKAFNTASDGGTEKWKESPRKGKKLVTQKKGSTKLSSSSKEPEPANPPGPPGRLRLMTNPWTDVFFEGRKLGQTPLVDVEVPSGRIKLRLVNTESGIDQEIILDIRPGERNIHRRNLY